MKENRTLAAAVILISAIAILLITARLAGESSNKSDIRRNSSLDSLVATDKRVVYSDHVNRRYMIDQDPDRKRPREELGPWRKRMRQNLICTAKEAEAYASYLTNTDGWIRKKTVRTTWTAFESWRDGSEIEDPRYDESPVIWVVSFQDDERLTMRATYLSGLFMPPNGDEEHLFLESDKLSVSFDEFGRGLNWYPAGSWKRLSADYDPLDDMDRIPEISSHVLAHWNISGKGLCFDPIPVPRPTPGATLDYSR